MQLHVNTARGSTFAIQWELAAVKCCGESQKEKKRSEADSCLRPSYYTFHHCNTTVSRLFPPQLLVEDPGRRHPHLKTPWQQCSRKAKSPGRVSYLSVFSSELQYTVFQMIETKSHSFIHVIATLHSWRSGWCWTPCWFNRDCWRSLKQIWS